MDPHGGGRGGGGGGPMHNQRPLQYHEVNVTRRDLAKWFDACYELEEEGGQYSWDSQKGAHDYETLRHKEILFVRHCESTYQTTKFSPPNTPRDIIKCDPLYKDAELTELGKVQAAELGARLAVNGFQPDLIVSSPLTRCLETAALVFPAAFLSATAAAPTPKLKVLSELLPEIVHSWGDTGRSLGAIIDGGVERAPFDQICREPKPQLEPFRGAESKSRFQKVGCSPTGMRRGCRWQLKSFDGRPEEDRRNAKLRCALVWRWLCENRPEERIAVFTHSKLIKASEHIHLVGPAIEGIQNGEFVRVVFE